MKLFYISLVAVCLGLIHAEGAQEIPVLTSRVNDNSHVLTPQQSQTLEAKLSSFETETTNQVVILTLPSLGGDEKEHFANKVFKAWKLGQKDKNNGVLLLNATGDRKVRIEVGYGLEGVLTDAICSDIVENDLKPQLKNSNYFAAYSLAINHIIQATKGEYHATSRPHESSEGSSDTIILVILFIVLFILAAVAGGAIHTLGGGVVGGGGTFLIVQYLMVLSTPAGIMFVIIGFIVGCLAYIILSSMGDGDFGSSFGGFSGGGDGGGFSGGGGDSGGGGAGGDY